MQETWVRSLGREDPLNAEMQLTPLFLPGKFHGQRSLTGYSPWDQKESEMMDMHAHIPHLYPFICWLMLMLVPCLVIVNSATMNSGGACAYTFLVYIFYIRFWKECLKNIILKHNYGIFNWHYRISKFKTQLFISIIIK